MYIWFEVLHSIKRKREVGGMYGDLLRKIAILIALTALSFAIFVADWWVGEAYALTHFYLIPIVLGAWYAGRTAGILLSLVSVAEILAATQTRIPLSEMDAGSWVILTRLAIYIPLTIVVARYREALAQEKHLARLDSLTGAVNSRTFNEAAALEIGRAKRTGNALTVAYVDLDNFKDINDRFGHLAGDMALKSVVKIMDSNTRRHDVVGRLGGDEFAILLPDTDEAGAIAGMNKLQDAVHQLFEENGWSTTVSIGAVTYRTPPDDVSELVHQADELMYEAKKSGKGRVEHRTIEKAG